MEDTTDTAIPAPQFQGIWLSRSVMELLWAGRINPRAAMLYATIQSFVEKGKGCWASNAYLGRLMGIEPRQVRECLEMLKTEKLIYQAAFDGRRRYLRTGEAPNAEGGEKSPRSQNEQNRVAKNRQSEGQEIATLSGAKSPPYSKGDSRGIVKDSGPGFLTNGKQLNPVEQWAAKATKVLWDAVTWHDIRADDADAKKWQRKFESYAAKGANLSETMEILVWHSKRLMSQFGHSVYCPTSFIKRLPDIKAAWIKEQKIATAAVSVEPIDRDEIICTAYRRQYHENVIRVAAIPADRLGPLIERLEAEGKI